MDCQGAQEEPEGRPGGPGRGNRSRGKAMVFQGPLDLLAFLTAHPWATWNSIMARAHLHLLVPVTLEELVLQPSQSKHTV